MTDCVVCNITIDPVRMRKRAKTCSAECTSERLKAKYAEANRYPKLNLSTGTVGALSELRAAVDLMLKGYSVFRALSPASPCDLVILAGDRFLRVEVKTGHRYATTGKRTYPKGNDDDYDILAVVLTDEIWYQPSLEDVVAGH